MMYPVMSLLRRLAAHSVYVTQEMLETVDDSLHIRLETASSALSLEKGVWGKANELVQIHELVSTAASSVQAAISLTESENRLAEQGKAKDILYTLVLGPETQEELDGVVTRRCRIAVVRGVYRATGKRLQRATAKKTIKKTFSNLPEGTIRL